MRYVLGLIAACLLLASCDTVAERVKASLAAAPAAADLKARNDVLAGELDTAHQSVLTAAVTAAASKLAEIEANRSLSDAQKEAAAAHVEADKAKGLAIQAAADAKTATARADALDKAARADTIRREIASAQAVCHWIAGICGLIGLLFTLSAVASYFFTQIPLPTKLLWQLAAACGGAVVVCEFVAVLAPFYWYFIVGLPLAGLTAFVLTHHKALALAHAEGEAADAATVQLGQVVRARLGDGEFTKLVGEIKTQVGAVGGWFKALVDKMRQ